MTPIILDEPATLEMLRAGMDALLDLPVDRVNEITAVLLAEVYAAMRSKATTHPPDAVVTDAMIGAALAEADKYDRVFNFSSPLGQLQMRDVLEAALKTCSPAGQSSDRSDAP